MQHVGRSSWRLSIGGPTRGLEHALFVRDTADLPVPPGPDAPGRLVAPDARVARMLSASERDQAAASWADWWRASIEVQLLHELDQGPLVGGRWHEELNHAPVVVGRALRWGDLADRPALQKAVLLCQARHESWREAQYGPSGSGLPELARERHQEMWAVRALAERVIAEHRLSPEQVRARVWFVSVPGLWWQRAWPGVVVATREATEDRPTLLAMHEDAFVSGL